MFAAFFFVSPARSRREKEENEGEKLSKSRFLTAARHKTPDVAVRNDSVLFLMGFAKRASFWQRVYRVEGSR